MSISLYREQRDFLQLKRLRVGEWDSTIGVLLSYERLPCLFSAMWGSTPRNSWEVSPRGEWIFIGSTGSRYFSVERRTEPSSRGVCIKEIKPGQNTAQVFVRLYYAKDILYEVLSGEQESAV
ncbi:MAG: hypothetical protein V4682_00845 [Patescibacteria group bacterium]